MGHKHDMLTLIAAPFHVGEVQGPGADGEDHVEYGKPLV
jgi:hypothetical protein